MGVTPSSLLGWSGGASLLAFVFPHWAVAADRAGGALAQAVHLLAFGMVALGAGMLAGKSVGDHFGACFYCVLEFCVVQSN